MSPLRCTGFINLHAVDPRHTGRIEVHQSLVRDVAISAREDLALTVAFDGKLVATNRNSHRVVQQIRLPSHMVESPVFSLH
jgi:hypothetical protein